MGTNEKNMTTGSPGKLIITFAIPLMLGNIFQQFYTMADTMIVGQVVGVEALAAVGAGDWLVWLVFGIMTGITQGFSILVAQFYGAREKENLKCAVAKSYIMTALLSVIVLAVSEGAVYHVLLFLQTPDNVIDLTMLYLRLIFAGIPIIAAYNIFAAILRALGSSVDQCGTGPVICGSFWLGCSRSSSGDSHRTGIFSPVLSDGVTENSGYPTGKTGLLQTAGNESAAFESGDSSCNPEFDHLCRGAYSTVCSQWIWIPVCGWIYSIKQIIWSFRDGCRFIRICNYNLCRPESWCKEISENPERCA